MPTRNLHAGDTDGARIAAAKPRRDAMRHLRTVQVVVLHGLIFAIAGAIIAHL